MNAPLSQRLRYRLDNFLAQGSGALFLSLLIAFLTSMAMFVGIRLVLEVVVPDAGRSVLEQFWTVFLELTAPGNMNQDNPSPLPYKLAAVLTGLTGVVIFSSLIAFLTNALNQAIQHLQKGHSKVIEQGHTLILGWSPRVVEILRELVEANESETDPCVVLLSEREKGFMDEFLRSEFPDRSNTRVVTRSGPTASLRSLEWVSADAASSAIVLADCGPAAPLDDKAASDAKVVKSVLALDALTRHREDFHVVSELFRNRNRQVVKDISPGRVTVVDAEEILAKIMVQTSRTSGLAVVYSELLSFHGCEMYLYGASWGGRSFGALQFHFDDGVPIGVQTEDGDLYIRPDPERPLQDGDQVLIVAEDDSTIAFQGQPVMTPVERTIPGHRLDQHQERQLILGWSEKAPILCREFSEYVLDGSSIDVMVSDPPESAIAEIQSLDAEIEGVTLNWLNKDPLNSEHLEAMQPFDYAHIIVLPQKPGVELPPERVDAETIVVLLHLRRLKREAREQGQRVDTKLLTEVLESGNRELVWQAGVDDFIISNRMVSMIFAQLSEEPVMQQVYDDLFQEEGSEIYIKPIELYVPEDELPLRLRFGDLMRLAQLRDGEVCIGVKQAAYADASDKNYGVDLIPPKDSELYLVAGDALVVVAEDEL